MATKKTTTKKSKSTTKPAASRRNSQKVTISRVEQTDETFINRVQGDLENKNAVLNLILGALIILVGAVLIFNYINKPKTDTSSTQTEVTTPNGDVSKDSLPGQYTVKTGDTLFSIAAKYYDDGYKYPEIAKVNSIADENRLEAGQVITIPNINQVSPLPTLSASNAPLSDTSSPSATPTDQPTPSATVAPTDTPTAQPQVMMSPSSAPMIVNSPDQMTNWGSKITTDTYTVQPGDWLSTISARAYGDVYSYQKLAQANNIANPDVIEVGTVLKIPH